MSLIFTIHHLNFKASFTYTELTYQLASEFAGKFASELIDPIKVAKLVMSDPYRRQRLLQGSNRINNNLTGRGRGRPVAPRSPEQIRYDQVSRAFARAFDQLQPNLEPARKAQLVNLGVNLDPNSVQGKNIEILATALVLASNGAGLTPASYPGLLREIVPGANNAFSDEVLLYIAYLQESQPNGYLLPTLPDWTDTWLPVDLVEVDLT